MFLLLPVSQKKKKKKDSLNSSHIEFAMLSWYLYHHVFNTLFCKVLICKDFLLYILTLANQCAVNMLVFSKMSSTSTQHSQITILLFEIGGKILTIPLSE